MRTFALLLLLLAGLSACEFFGGGPPHVYVGRDTNEPFKD